MEWPGNLDQALFRFINGGMANPVMDAIMPLLSGNPLFIPVAILCGAFLLYKGGLRGAICLSLLVLVIAIGDGFIVRSLKHALNTPRPAGVFPDAHLLVGRGTSGSMPSAHAANWFSAAFVMFIYYRRSVWFMLPVACAVAFSRIYNGAHFPSDVVAGAVIGAGYAAAIAWSARALWFWAGRKWFPLWWEKAPDLFAPPVSEVSPEEGFEDEPLRPPRHLRAPSQAAALQPLHFVADKQWLYLGWVLTGVILAARLAYIWRSGLELSEDEAYQWVWSKHLALSYYSKPPLIAFAQFFGTGIWGDTELGVRFLSPVLSAGLGVMVLNFFAREVNARAGFFLLLICTATPLLAAGSVLMTIDPLSVFFWCGAMLSGWRAVQENSRTKDWLFVGLWMGLGFLSKYVQLLQLLCWAIFFILWRPARKQFRKPGVYLALGINLLATIPVVAWNVSHKWATVNHVAGNAGLREEWRPSIKYPLEFLASEAGLLNPVFFGAMLYALFAFWKLGRRNPKLLYFFSMGAPLFLVYALYTLRSRVLPNWIAPAVVPLFCFMTIFWDTRWRLDPARLKPWLTAGLALGFSVVIIMHDTDLVKAITGRPLPAALNPLRRAGGWEQTARIAGAERELLMSEGKPVFIIGSHYGITGEISFYLPEARESIRTAPLVYALSSPIPRNQFHFWPGYETRKGENAIFVREVKLSATSRRPMPEVLKQEFASVTDLGTQSIVRKGQVLRVIELYACRNLK